MKKIHLVGLGDDREDILKTLMELGVCEISNPEEKVKSHELEKLVSRYNDEIDILKLEHEKLKVEKALDILNKYDKRKKALFDQKKTITIKELNGIWNEKEKLSEITEKILGFNDKLTSLKSDKNKKTNLIDMIEPWSSIDISLDINSTKETTILVGVIPENSNPIDLKNELEETVKYAYCHIVNHDKEQSNVLLIYHHLVEEDVTVILKRYGFLKAMFKDVQGSAKDNIERLKREIQEIDKLCANIGEEISSLCEFVPRIEILYDYFAILIERKMSIKNLLKTEKTFMFFGWVPETVCNNLKEILGKKWDVYIEFNDPEEDEECPVLLDNRGLSEAVEGVTNMYSPPNYKEVDPNAIMAPFFVLFFGLMLSDAGYGVVMFLVSLFILMKFKLEDSMRKFMKLMMFCGIATVFWGALFGGWFGIKALSEKPIWFNPAEDPQELLRWALLFGVIHIFIGIGIRGVNLIKQKKYIDIIFDVFVWYVFFIGFIFIALPYVPKAKPEELTGIVEIGKYMLLGGGIVLLLTQGRAQKGIAMKILSGLASLYDLVGFMSDVLSYSRLLALGLASSVIATIINDMAFMININIVLRIIIITIILIAGHLFNFAINALGAYVHSSRLQYIEFFGKFYKGGGTAFEPLKIKTKYINIQ